MHALYRRLRASDFVGLRPAARALHDLAAPASWSRLADSAISKRIGVAVLTPVPQVEGGRLKITLRRVSVRAVPMPHFLTPEITMREDADAAGRGRFAVEAALPMFGPLVAYRGILTPARVT